MKPPLSNSIPLAKYPAIRIALLFIGGIILGSYSSLSLYLWAVIFGTIIVGWAAMEYFTRHSNIIIFNYISICCYLTVIVIFGSLWITLFTPHEQPASARLLSIYAWKKIKVTGTIESLRKSSSGKYHLDVAVKRTTIDDSLVWKQRYTLRAIYNPVKKPLPKMARLGAVIHFQATVYPLEGARNPHQFDYKKFLVSKGIYVQAGITHIYSIHLTDRWFSWLTWRRNALALIRKNFSSQTTPLAEAVLLGYKNDLPRSERADFAKVGLAHIMAVSGLHVGLLIAPFWLLMPYFWGFRRGRHVGLALLIAVLYIYAGLTGFSASVMRASITGGLLTYGRLFRRPRDPKNLTAAAAIIILLIDPRQLFSVSFQLSFAAVFAILLIIPVFQQYLPQWSQTHWYGKLGMIVLISIVVQAALYPLLSYYFDYFALAGPIANPAVLPLLTFILPYALLLLPLAALFPAVAFILNTPCRWFFTYLQWFVLHVSSWGWSWIHTPSPGVFIFLIWITVILMIASLAYAKVRWKFLILFLFVIVSWQAVKLDNDLQPPVLKITMLDVGQGDAAVISTPSGRHFLIDAGRWTPGYNSGSSVILPYLKAMNIHKLDAIFLSHPHADHIGGMPALIKNIPIDTIYNSGSAYNSKLYHQYLAMARKHHIPVEALSAGDRVPLDPAMQIFIYGPSKLNHYHNVNQRSLIIELIYGNEQFLFEGDAQKKEERLLLKHYGSMLNTDFLKVAHHGSKTSSSTAFLRVATPQIEAVSLGFRNRYHFPDPLAVERLKATHAKIYYTSRSGALEFISDGTNIKHIRWRK